MIPTTLKSNSWVVSWRIIKANLSSELWWNCSMINVVLISKFLVGTTQEWRRLWTQIVVFDIRASRRCRDVSGDSAVGLVFLLVACFLASVVPERGCCLVACNVLVFRVKYWPIQNGEANGVLWRVWQIFSQFSVSIIICVSGFVTFSSLGQCSDVFVDVVRVWRCCCSLENLC